MRIAPILTLLAFSATLAAQTEPQHGVIVQDIDKNANALSLIHI